MLIDSAWKAWYRSQHERRCRFSGTEFEDYATEILKRLHSDFINPEPMGTHGDEGCDGLAETGTIFYACYGARAKTKIDSKTKDKLESDFSRALNSGFGFEIWRFVTNSPFGPEPTKSLTALRKNHQEGSERPLNLELWLAPDDLWWNVVNILTKEQLNEVFPGVPHSQDVELSDLVELINSLETDTGKQVDELATINPVPTAKMDYNKIPESTRAEFNEGRLLSHRIDRWFEDQADPGLRDIKAQRFRMLYEEVKNVSTDPREIVESVYVALAGSNPRLSTKRANAVYAVTVYFFDSCDIFEEPPADQTGGTK